MRIGLLEDDGAVQEMVRLVLQSEGHTVVFAATSAACPTIVCKDGQASELFALDLLIVDVRPAKAALGTIFIKQVRAYPHLCALPIIVMTAYKLPDEQELVRLHVSLLSKPFHIDTLLLLVDELTSHAPP